MTRSRKQRKQPGSETAVKQVGVRDLLAKLSLDESTKVESPSNVSRLFLEDKSYPLTPEKPFSSLFDLAKQELFFSSRLRGHPVALSTLDVGVEDLLYAPFFNPVIHLFVNGMLVKAVVMPSGQQSVAEVCELLAKAYGGSFTPMSGISSSLPLSDFARTAAKFNMALPLAWEKPAKPHGLEIGVEFAANRILIDAGVGNNNAMIFSIERLMESLVGTRALFDAEVCAEHFEPTLLADFTGYSLLPILANSKTTVRAIFKDKSLHVIIGLIENGKCSLRHLDGIGDSQIIMKLADWLAYVIPDGICSPQNPNAILHTVLRIEVPFVKKIRPWETEAYRDLFYKHPYEDDGNIEGFMAFVHGTHSAFHGKSLIAPYFAMVQSSGTGKTRLAIEVAMQNRVISLYILCADTQGAIASPFVQALKGYFLSLVGMGHKDIVDMLASWMLNKLHMAIVKLLGIPLDDRWLMCGMYAKPDHADYQSDFWKDVLASDRTASTLQNDGSVKVPVVIAFDEARGLTNMINILRKDLPQELNQYDRKLMFHALRRALASLSNNLKGFVFSSVMLDTNSSVANFLPQSKDDPSARLISANMYEHKELFPPHFYLASFDSTAKDIGEMKGLISRRQENADSLVKMLTLGRPLWNISRMVHKGSLFDQETTLLEAAEVKLGQKSKRDEHDPFLAKLIPILARLSLRLNGATVLTSDLVAYYLALLYYCSKERDYLRVTYREEPVIGAAMAALLNAHTTNKVSKCALESLNDYLLLHGGDAGFFGELSTQLVLLASIDHASNGRPHYGCSVKDFFESLAGSSVSVPFSFANAKIAFTQFIKTQSPSIGRDLIERAVKFCYAISGVHRNTGFDLLIPIELPTKEIGCILVEVKNVWSNQTITSEVHEKLLEQVQIYQKAGFPALGLAVSLGQMRSDKFVMEFVVGSSSLRLPRFDVVLTPENSWGQPELMLKVINTTASSLIVRDCHLVPQTDRNGYNFGKKLFPKVMKSVLVGMLHKESRPCSTPKRKKGETSLERPTRKRANSWNG